MKELKVIENQLNAILKEGQTKVDEYIKEVETSNLAEDQANRDYIKARDEMNIEAYAKASQDKRTAQDIAELYNSRLQSLKDDPFITEAEYQEYTKQIKAEMDTINRNGTVKASKLFKELEAIKEEVSPSYNKANELLSKLQNNIYKHSADKVMKEAKENKTPIDTEKVHNKYKDNSLLIAIDFILKSQVAEMITKKGCN